MERHASSSTASHTRPSFLDAQYKPSTPIEIPQPKRRTSGGMPLHTRATSPDLIFDMSPVDSSLTSQCSLHLLTVNNEDRYFPMPGNAAWRAVSSSPTAPFHEPFLYSFPQLSPRRVKSEQSTPRVNHDGVDPFGAPSSPIEFDSTGVRSPMHHKNRILTSSFWREDELPYSFDTQRQTAMTAKVQPLSTVGPESAAGHSSLHAQLSGRLRIVSSPPLTSLPGDDNSCMSPMDKEYGREQLERHRMRRTRNENRPIKFDQAQVMSSMRASVRI